jgi:hypothetical protein
MATHTVIYGGLAFERVLSNEGIHPFDAVAWEEREARIDDAKGNVVFRQENVRVPTTWSQTAFNIVASKYLHGKVGSEGRERGVDALISRVTSTVRKSGEVQGYFRSSEAAEIFEAELATLLVGQYASFNSPVWFNVGLGISRMEACLATPMPLFQHPDGLLDWYLNSGSHRLELEASRAFHDLIGCEDEEIYSAGKSYLAGIDGETAPTPGSLAFRVRERLNSLDAKLAAFVESDSAKLANDERSVISFLKEGLKDELYPILAGDSDRRVWVLIFDGMRFDTWEDIVQPLLGECFSISGGARFCVLPSYTLYARTSLLAGATATAWAANKSPTSRDEAVLFAKNIGLAAHEVKDKLRFVTDADNNQSKGGARLHRQDGQASERLDISHIRRVSRLQGRLGLVQ